MKEVNNLIWIPIVLIIIILVAYQVGYSNGWDDTAQGLNECETHGKEVKRIAEECVGVAQKAVDKFGTCIYELDKCKVGK